MKKFLKWVPWKTVFITEAAFSLGLIVGVRGKVWSDWLIGLVMVFGIVCWVAWSLRRFNSEK